VLSRDEICVRNLVRFDADVAVGPAGIGLLGFVESFASHVISGYSPSFLDFLIEGGDAPRSAAVATSPSLRVKGLGVHLARVHKLGMHRGDISTIEGKSARFAVGAELRNLGLIQHCTLPVSVALRGKLSVYRRIAKDEGRLASFLIDAICESVEIATRILETVDRLDRSWRAELPSKKGSVLDAAIDMSLSEVVVVGDRLRSVTGANKSNVYRAVQAMVGIGALSEVTGRRKNQIWVATELVDTVEVLMAGGRSVGKIAAW
jgi:hypothetical protein